MSEIHVKDLDPRQWVTTKEAAEMLGVNRCSVLPLLREAGIDAVCPVDSARRFFYWRAAVRKLARARAAERQVPPGYVTKPEAAKMLGFSQEWATKLLARWELPHKPVQHGKGKGKFVYRRKHIELLAAARASEDKKPTPLLPLPRDLRLLALSCKEAGLSVLEYSALCMLEEAGDWVPMPQIVEWLGVSRAAASQTVSGWMMPLDAVEKTRSPEDERTVWVRITEKGKERLSRIRGLNIDRKK